MTHAIARKARTALSRARASFGRLHLCACNHYMDEHAERCFGFTGSVYVCDCLGYKEVR